MKEKKINKKKAQGAETKKKLYEVAEKLFAQHDFADVNVEDITDAVGITKGAFYVHFESKDALIAQVISDYVSRVDTNYKEFLDSLPSELSTSQILISLVEKIADVLTYNISCENMKKLYQIMVTGTLDSEAVMGYGRELYTLFYDILKQGIKCGEFKSNLSLEILSRHFVMAFRGISYEWCVRYPNFDLKVEAITHFNLLLDGIQSQDIIAKN